MPLTIKLGPKVFDTSQLNCIQKSNRLHEANISWAIQCPDYWSNCLDSFP
jgi:hypothetical protein